MSKRTHNLEVVIDGLENWDVIRTDYDQLIGQETNYAVWFCESIGSLRRELLVWAQAELRKRR